MKYFVKQKVFTLGERFEIYDSSNIARYYVEGSVWSMAKKLTMKDYNGNVVFELHQELFHLLPKFNLLKNGQVVASVSSKFSLLKPEYDIQPFGWNVVGDVFQCNYQICHDQNLIATIKKAMFSVGDYYEMDIYDSNNVELVLAIILVIDAIIEMRRTD